MRIAILCSDGPHNKYLIFRVCKNFGDVKIFIEPGKEQLNWKLHKKKYRQYFQLKYQIIRRKIVGSDKFRKKFFEPLIDASSFEQYDLEIVQNINDESVCNGLITYKPNIIIVMGTTILHKKILHIAEKSDIINIHGGYLPYYKGNHCFFFAYYNKEFDKIGSTLHYVNSGIDSGDIIDWAVPAISKDDTPESLYCKAEKMAVDKLIELLQRYQKGETLPRYKQENVGHLYYTKDRKLYYDIILLLRKMRGEYK